MKKILLISLLSFFSYNFSSGTENSSSKVETQQICPDSVSTHIQKQITLHIFKLNNFNKYALLRNSYFFKELKASVHYPYIKYVHSSYFNVDSNFENVLDKNFKRFQNEYNQALKVSFESKTLISQVANNVLAFACGTYLSNVNDINDEINNGSFVPKVTVDFWNDIQMYAQILSSAFALEFSPDNINSVFDMSKFPFLVEMFGDKAKGLKKTPLGLTIKDNPRQVTSRMPVASVQCDKNQTTNQRMMDLEDQNINLKYNLSILKRKLDAIENAIKTK